MIIGIWARTVLKEIRLWGAVHCCDAVYTKCWKSDRSLGKPGRGLWPRRTDKGAIDRKKLGALVFGDPAKLGGLGISPRPWFSAPMVKRTGRGIGLTAIDAFAPAGGDAADLFPTVAMLTPASAGEAHHGQEGIWRTMPGPGEGQQ